MDGHPRQDPAYGLLQKGPSVQLDEGPFHLSGREGGEAQALARVQAGTPLTVTPPVKGASVRKPQWGDFGSIWKTIREVDVNAIRHEAERGATIVCIGQIGALWWVEQFLRTGPDRYPPQGGSFALVPLGEAGAALAVAGTADLAIIALDAAAPLSGAEVEGLQRVTSAQTGDG